MRIEDFDVIEAWQAERLAVEARCREEAERLCTLAKRRVRELGIVEAALPASRDRDRICAEIEAAIAALAAGLLAEVA